MNERYPTIIMDSDSLNDEYAVQYTRLDLYPDIYRTWATAATESDARELLRAYLVRYADCHNLVWRIARIVRN